jgi:hypothetical protein
MVFAEVTSELTELYKDQLGHPNPSVSGLREAYVQRWSTSIGGSRSTLYDEIALYLARGFHAFELTFAFCDAVVNDLHGVISFAHEDRPDLFWKVFLAFDEGEFSHHGNRDEDPQQVYTRPMIGRIINGVSSTS